MPRTNLVKKCRKDQGNCRACGKHIEVGMPYKWAKPRYGAEVRVCENCAITPSMVSSSKMVAVWTELEALNLASFETGDFEGLASELDQVSQTAREVGEEYQESADNQREYFPDSETADENEEKANGLEEFATELEEAAQAIRDLENEHDELTTEREGVESNKSDLERELESEGKEEGVDLARAKEVREEIDEAVTRIDDIDGRLGDIWDEATSAAEEAVGNCP